MFSLGSSLPGQRGDGGEGRNCLPQQEAAKRLEASPYPYFSEFLVSIVLLHFSHFNDFLMFTFSVGNFGFKHHKGFFNITLSLAEVLALNFCEIFWRL